MKRQIGARLAGGDILSWWEMERDNWLMGELADGRAG